MGAEQQYIDLFEQYLSLLDQGGAPALNALRQQAMQDFAAQGFPTLKQEEARYTDVPALFAPDYGLNLRRTLVPTREGEIFQCEVPNMSTQLYLIVNDMFHSASHASAQLPDGVLAGSLREMALSHPGLVEKYYGRLAPTKTDAITALNTAYCQDGFFIYVPKGVRVPKVQQLVNLNHAGADLMSHRRLLIILEDNAELSLLSCDHTLDEHQFLSTQVCEIYVGKGASFDLYELEETHHLTRRCANLYLEQQADSRVLLDNMTLHNGITRNRVHASFEGEGAKLALMGMAISDKQQHVDNLTFIDHKVPRCTCQELYKYVLDGQAVGAFAGKILVRPGAQQTDAQQTNKNLCMTRTARMYSQPQLEIYADDVKCSHGSSTGQLDESALFYMQTRGIPPHEARLLLMNAFVADVIGQVRIPALADRLRHLVEKRFRGEMQKCKGCKMCK
ncbi:MAG: Fe-S cluster assembly protein SufD [Bacteroidaceae bacterium]|jgi:Fe-S cluster assembly protein SufD